MLRSLWRGTVALDDLSGEGDLWAEAQDLIDALGHTLLQLGQQPPDATLPLRDIDSMFRDAHTLKSLFRLLDCQPLGSLANGLEDLLDVLRRERKITSQQASAELLQAVEIMAASCTRAQGGALLDSQAIDQVLQSLSQSLGRNQQALGASAHAQAIAEAPATPFPLDSLSPLEQQRLGQALESGERVVFVAVKLPLSDMANAFAGIGERLAPLADLLASLPSSWPDDDEALRFDLVLSLRPECQDAATLLAAIATVAPSWLLATPASPPSVDVGRGPSLPAAPASPQVAPLAASPERDGAHEPSLRPPLASASASSPEGEGGHRPARPSPASVAEPIGAQTVRVDIRKLDRLMHYVGELTLTQLALQELSESLRAKPACSAAGLEVLREGEALERRLTSLRNGLMQVRMVPIGQLFERLLRAGQQAARELGKEIRFSVGGEATELDKFIAEKLVDPMMHLVRNAVDHGIERPEVRRGRNKSTYGAIELVAKTRGSQVIVQVRDDGGGIDLTEARKTAVRQGLVAAESVEQLRDEQIFALLSAPGFSTRREVSAYSGRGVGLDVAKSELEKLGGALEIHATLGEGATFSLVTPVTLAIVPSMVVASSSELFALPLGHVDRTLGYDERDTFVASGRRMLRVDERVMPLIALDQAFGLPATPATGEGFVAGRFVVVVGIAQKRLALLVDDLVAQQDIVIKSLGSRLAPVAAFAGAAELASRRLVLVLNTLTLLHEAGEELSWQTSLADAEALS